MEVGRKKQRATVLAIWYLGKDFAPNPQGTRCLRFGLWEEVVSKILGARCLRLSVWEGFFKKKLRGTALGIWEGLVSKAN